MCVLARVCLWCACYVPLLISFRYAPLILLPSTFAASPLVLDTRRSCGKSCPRPRQPPLLLCPQAPLLLSSSIGPAPPLVLDTRRFSPCPRHASLLLSSLALATAPLVFDTRSSSCRPQHSATATRRSSLCVRACVCQCVPRSDRNVRTLLPRPTPQRTRPFRPDPPATPLHPPPTTHDPPRTAA